MNFQRHLMFLAGMLAAVQWMSGAASAQVTDTRKGKGGSEVQGSAGIQGAQGQSPDQEKCDKPMGAIAVVEPQNYIMQALARYNLQSPTGLIRLMIQQSNCFVVIERGAGMQNMMQERELSQAGELRQGSNMGGGQMVGADFVLTPSVVFSEDDAGGLGGAIGGLLGRKNSTLGAVAGGLKFKEAQTSMLVADARSGVQVAAAEGSARKADLRLGALIGAGGLGTGLGGYGKTNEGRMIAASLLDNYNGVVRAVRANPSLQREVGTLAEEAGKKVQSGAVFEPGDVLRPKIAGVKLMSEASDSSRVVTTLDKHDEVIFIGEEKGGYLSVESGNGAGWVKKILISR